MKNEEVFYYIKNMRISQSKLSYEWLLVSNKKILPWPMRGESDVSHLLSEYAVGSPGDNVVERESSPFKFR